MSSIPFIEVYSMAESNKSSKASLAQDLMPRYGLASYIDRNSEVNQISFQIRQMMGHLHVAHLVKVVAVDIKNDHVGMVSVTPMTHQRLASEAFLPHGTQHELPYFRIQGGSNAVIIDPKIGDIGVAIYCDRDITKVKITRDNAGPDSYRQHAMEDGLYLGGFLNGKPEQFVEFKEDGIHLRSPQKVFIDAPNTEISGNVKINGEVGIQKSLKANGDVTAGSISLKSHIHSKGEKGAPTGKPIG